MTNENRIFFRKENNIKTVSNSSIIYQNIISKSLLLINLKTMLTIDQFECADLMHLNCATKQNGQYYLLIETSKLIFSLTINHK